MQGVITCADDVSTARRRVRRVCAGCGLSDETLDDVQLALTELISNALRHGAPPVIYSCECSASKVLICVDDGSADVGGPHQPHWVAEHGRGLQIVDALAAHWGTESRGAGKRVWAVLG